MAQSLYINFDAEDLRSARVRGASDLRAQKFTQLVAGDSIQYDIYLTGADGLLDIQGYAEVRLGLGNLDARPESGDYLIAGTDTLVYNHTASELKTVVEAQVAGATVTKLTDFVFKVQFNAVGAQTIPSLNFANLQPRSTVSVTRLITGDATTKETWLWRLYRDPIAFTSVFTDVSGSGVRGVLNLATAGVYDLLEQFDQIQTFLEVELTDTDGNVQTVLQTKIRLNGEVIGHNFSGSIPTSPTNSPEANAFLESFPDPTIVGNLTVDGGVTAPNIPHNTDSVIICNQGDNIQDKWEEAAALTPNGNPLSPANLASLIVMSGTYGSIFTPSDNYINIVGIGSPKISNISINGASSANFATIEGLETGGYEDAGNYGTIKNIITVSMYIFVENAGYIQNVKAEQLDFETNNGIIDNCESNSVGSPSRGFGGFIGSINNGTIKNCTAKAEFSFGQQTALGLTENCIGVDEAFIGESSQVSGNIIEGTYRNCRGGKRSFFGKNTSTIIKECTANYINCTAEINSFCFVNTAGAETHFSGTAINCTSGNNGFCRAVSGITKILAGAIIENCTGGTNSFANTTSSTNEGTILRCRTNQKGANPFRVTGTGKVRLCLDGDFNEVNLG